MNYRKAFSEVYSIIEVLDNKLKSRIPDGVINMIECARDKNYIFQYDNTKSIDKQNISNEAQSIIAFLYKNYMCSDDEKIKWQEYDRFKAEKMKRLQKNWSG